MIQGLAVTDTIERGVLLIAHPMLQGNVFGRSVILITEYSEETGAVGVIVNKPTAHTVKAVLQGVKPAFVERNLNYGGPCNGVNVLYKVTAHGEGPVNAWDAEVAGIARPEDELLVAGGKTERLFLTDYDQASSRTTEAESTPAVEVGAEVEAADAEVAEKNILRVMHGSCVWEKSQLECELLEGSWIAVQGPTDAQTEDGHSGMSVVDALFAVDVDTSPDDNTWKVMLRSLPDDELRGFANHPADECVRTHD